MLCDSSCVLWFIAYSKPPKKLKKEGENKDEASQFSAAIAFLDGLVLDGEFAYGAQTPRPFVGLPAHFEPKRKEACSEWLSYKILLHCSNTSHFEHFLNILIELLYTLND